MKIKRFFPKIISALLIVVMIATCAPVMGFAADETSVTTNVAYIANTAYGVKIRVNAVEGATGYYIYRSANDGDYERIGFSESVSYIDKTAENGVYYKYYAVACVEGVETNDLPLVTATAEGTTKSIMFVETPKFTVENTDIGPIIEINPVEGATLYEIKRCGEGESAYTKIGTVSGDISDPYFTDIDAENGKSYKYSVAAVVASGYSYYYSSQIVVEIAEVMSDENATAITYIANKSEGVKINLKAVDGAESYTIYRKSDKETYRAIAVIDSTTYVDTTVENNVLYTYRVAVTGYYFSENERSIRFISTPEYTVSNAGTCVCVDFEPVDGVDYYEIKRRDTTTSLFTKIGTVKADEESIFYDANVQDDTTYIYSVVAVTGKYFSYYTAKRFTTFLTPNVVLSNVASGMKITYTKVEGATRYTIYRKTADTDWEVLTSFKPRSYFNTIDKTAISGIEYSYSVQADTADNSTGHDPYGTTFEYLESPTVFLSNDETSVTVDFTKSAGATGYKVYRKVNNTGSLKYVGSTDADTLTFIDTDVVEGETYTYAVRALGEKVMSYYKSSSISVAMISFDDEAIVDDEIIIDDVIVDDTVADVVETEVDEDALTAIEFGELNITEEDVIDIADNAATTTSGIIELLENFIENLPIENSQVFTKVLDVLNAIVNFFSEILDIVA